MPYDKIDAHHHLWKYSAAEYLWISENMGPLGRDFLIQDLVDVLEESDIEGVGWIRFGTVSLTYPNMSKRE